MFIFRIIQLILLKIQTIIYVLNKRKIMLVNKKIQLLFQISMIIVFSLTKIKLVQRINVI